MKVHLVSPRNTHNGYGAVEDCLVRYLARLDVDLSHRFSGQRLSLVLAPPPALATAKAPIKILYSMIEGDTTPPSWIPFLKQADFVLTPSRFSQSVFDKAGVSSVVVPLGYDAEVFSPTKRSLKTNPFTVLHYEAFQNRKGWKELLGAWMLSLNPYETEAKLILKTIIPVNQIPSEVFEFKNVEIIAGRLPHHCLADLLGGADLFVFPSRGEGFSLPPLEAMATGCPVIVTKAHAHLDYFDKTCMIGVKSEKKIPTDYPGWEKVGFFTRCFPEDLAKKIDWAFNHREEINHMGEAAINHVQKYRFENTAKRLKEVLGGFDA